MSKILNYIRITEPETARANNTLSGVKSIREEIKTELEYLKRCKDTFRALEMGEEAKKCDDEIRELAKWFLAFGLN